MGTATPVFDSILRTFLGIKPPSHHLVSFSDPVIIRRIENAPDVTKRAYAMGDFGTLGLIAWGMSVIWGRYMTS